MIQRADLCPVVHSQTEPVVARSLSSLRRQEMTKPEVIFNVVVPGVQREMWATALAVRRLAGASAWLEAGFSLALHIAVNSTR